MEHMNRKFPKGNNLLREHKESTLEKNQAKRQKRKELMSKEYDKWAKSQLDPTLDK